MRVATHSLPAASFNSRVASLTQKKDKRIARHLVAFGLVLFGIWCFFAGTTSSFLLRDTSQGSANSAGPLVSNVRAELLESKRRQNLLAKENADLRRTLQEYLEDEVSSRDSSSLKHAQQNALRGSNNVEQAFTEHVDETSPPDNDLVRFVDVRRGTLNKNWKTVSRGNALPIISRPFGMNHWTIANNNAGPWFYNPKDPKFAGIRCTHQPSPWIGDYGFFDVLPFSSTSHRGATYQNDEALLTPSYMKLSVQCVEKLCTVIELTGTQHGGLFSIALPSDGELQGIKLTHLEIDKNSVLAGTNSMSFVGKTKSSTIFQPPRHFSLYVSVDVSIIGTSRNLSLKEDSVVWPSEVGDATKVVVRVGTSMISHEMAKLHREQQVGEHRTIEALRAEGRQAWNSLLERVTVEPDEEQSSEDVQELKTMLYSALYRGLLFPRQLGETDASGKLVHYSPYDTSGKTYPGPLSTDSGFWDAYRAVYPMLHLVYPDLVGDILVGWVNAIREDPNGMLVQWASPGRVASMVGSMGEASLAEGIVNGALIGDDAKDAYAYMKKSATQGTNNGRAMMKEYLKRGYVPYHRGGESAVSMSLNYYLSDFAVSLAAQHLGDMTTSRTLNERSRNWRKLFDAEDKQFFRPRSTDGTFVEPFEEFEWMGPYTEGGPWQYRFYVPHEPLGLREAYKAFRKTKSATAQSHLCDLLTQMMTMPGTVSNREKIHEEIEMQSHSFGQYAHNNQPVHHVLYMFAHAGCPSEGQRWIHHTLRTQYGPFGFAGDEDNGEMSSWYILSSLGLYSLVPGSGEYQLGAPPLFRKVTIHRTGHRKSGNLIIERRHIPISAQPLESFTPAKIAFWNKKPIDLSTGAATIPYRDLLEGGKLVFQS